MILWLVCAPPSSHPRQSGMRRCKNDFLRSCHQNADCHYVANDYCLYDAPTFQALEDSFIEYYNVGLPDLTELVCACLKPALHLAFMSILLDSNSATGTLRSTVTSDGIPSQF